MAYSTASFVTTNVGSTQLDERRLGLQYSSLQRPSLTTTTPSVTAAKGASRTDVRSPLGRARVAADQPRVEADEGCGVGKLREPFGIARDAKQQPATVMHRRRVPDIGKRNRDRQLAASIPFRRMRSERLALRVAHQRRAVDDIAGCALELDIREKGEPGLEGRSIGVVGEPARRTRRGPQRGAHDQRRGDRNRERPHGVSYAPSSRRVRSGGAHSGTP